MDRNAECAAAPVRDNAATRLDGATDSTKKLAEEVAVTVNSLRDALIGKKLEKTPGTMGAVAPRDVSPGFFGTVQMRVEDTNRTLNYVLDELRIVLNEVS
jgi:hypothetical protein